MPALRKSIHLHQWDASKPIAFSNGLFTKRSMMMTDRNNWQIANLPTKYAPILPKQVQAQREL
ncbi:hypothetical protein C7B76_26120 [filamentous cyanobacterium CCP2]|nr:hypothetical protein C7B76_26120 [filamentous cyanobacterium CCP2]